MNDLNIAWKGTSLVIPKHHKELIALFEAEKISFQPRGDIEADNDVILENRKNYFIFEDIFASNIKNINAIIEKLNTKKILRKAEGVRFHVASI